MKGEGPGRFMADLASFILWGLVFVTGIALLLAWFAPAQGAERVPYRTEYLPCNGSDTDTNCVWDYTHMGEGDGFSWSFFVGRDGRVYRLPHHVAHRLLHP